MKVIVDSSALNKALKQCSPAVNQNTILPILLSVLCKVNKTEMEIISTNLNLTCISKVKCESNETFDFLLEFDKISNIASVLAEPLIINVGEQITINGSKYKLGKAEDVVNFPRVEKLEPHFETEVDNMFLYYLQRSMEFISQEVNEVRFNNIHLDFDGKNASIVSTDTWKMFRYMGEAATTAHTKYLVSPKFAQASKVFSKNAMFGGNEKLVSLQDDTFRIICRVDENKFPNYDPFFNPYKHNCKASKSDLMKALQQMMVFGSKLICDFNFIKDGIKIVFDDALAGNHFEDTIKCEHSVEIEKITFNAAHLKGVLNALPDDEENVLMSFNTHTTLVHFDTQDSDLNLILIPIFNN